MPAWGDFKAVLGSTPKVKSPPTTMFDEVPGSLAIGHSFGLRL